MLTFLEMALYAIVMALLWRDFLTFRAIGRKRFFQDGYATVDMVRVADANRRRVS
jgi:hypothetical protein